MFNGRSRVWLPAVIQRGIVDRDMCGAAIALLAVLVAAPVCAEDGAPRFVAAWGNAPTGVALDGQGFLYVSDTGNDRIQKFEL